MKRTLMSNADAKEEEEETIVAEPGKVAWYANRTPGLVLVPDPHVRVILTPARAAQQRYFYFIGCGNETGESVLRFDLRSTPRAVELVNQLCALVVRASDRVVMLDTFLALAGEPLSASALGYVPLLNERFGPSGLGAWEFLDASDQVAYADDCAGFATYYNGDM